MIAMYFTGLLLAVCRRVARTGAQPIDEAGRSVLDIQPETITADAAEGRPTLRRYLVAVSFAVAVVGGAGERSGTGAEDKRVAAGGRDHVRRREVRSHRGDLPLARAPGGTGRAVQGAEHVQQFDGRARRSGDRAGAADASGRGRDSGRGGHEPGAAQAGQ